MKVLAIIPARGGSKGIPRKNLVNFRQKPLINWSIETALKSTVITDVVVSSDDDEILSVASKFRNVLALKRPKELATDNSRTEPVLKQVIETLGVKKYDYLILLQPTSPLRTFKDVDLAFSKLKESKANSLISVCSLEHHPYKTFKIDKNGFLEGIIDNNFPFTPRQVLPQTFRANGAIYIISIEEFLKNESLLSGKTIPFEMSEEKSLDIDTFEDLKQMENLLKS